MKRKPFLALLWWCALLVLTVPALALATPPQAGFANALSKASNGYVGTPFTSAIAFRGSSYYTVEMWVNPSVDQIAN